MTQPLLQAADLRGAARLTTEAVAGIASLVEAMHARIASPLRVPNADRAVHEQVALHGIPGLVYKTVRGVTRLVGGTAEGLLSWLESVLEPPTQQQPLRPDREGVVAALNGVLGDHLAASDNPLAIGMSFRRSGRPLVLERSALRSRLPGATRKVLVLLHGLCRNDLQWEREGHDHGKALERDFGYTPVYLNYNSGLSVSTNGRILVPLMEHLYDAWPVPIERLVLVGHSMGGLVARSAIYHAVLPRRSGVLRWPARVNDLICLGTPHLGAPLAVAGAGIEALLSAAPYAEPLARLGKLRSAGIDDLRRGDITGDRAGDHRAQPCARIDLPDWVRCYAVAASLGATAQDLKSRSLGDGLVPVASALGEHSNRNCRLVFAEDRRAVVTETGHLDLLSSAEVYGHLRRWLGAEPTMDSSIDRASFVDENGPSRRAMWASQR